MVFNSKLRLLGTQFAVNFHFLLPSSQGSAGPGKGDLRFVFYSKGGAGFSGHVGHKPSLGSTSSPSKTLLTLVTMPHCPHDNRHTHTCTRTHAHAQQTAFCTQCTPTLWASMALSTTLPGWQLVRVTSAARAVMSCPNHCA